MDVHTRPLLRGVRWIAVAFAVLTLNPPASAQIAGKNVNMVSGTQWPGGDPFLQRQNEPSIAVSSRNPFHLLAGANDYRTVDLALTTNGETGDAWLGLFKSLDGGATWRSTLLPGCPYATTICSGAPNVRNAGYAAAADPTVRAGSNGMFYYAGLVFNRGFNPASAIVVSRLIDLNNKENADPNDILNGDSIQYVSTSVVATGTQSLFLDKPTMAVDVPRWGATTCKLSVNQPGNGVVNQSFAAGNVYVAYTGFHEAPNTDPENASGPQLSTLYFVRSTNCGTTWSKPIAISGNIAINQGTSIAIDPNLGTIYIAWREFAYKTATVNQPDAIVVVASVDGGQHFTPPLRISTFTPFDEGTTNTSFRTNAYPTIAVDNSSRVYVAYAARNTIPSGDARIVLTNSFLGLFWSAPVPIDNPPINPFTNPSGRGHQIMPTLTFAGGRLSLLYYDLRLDHTYSAYTPLLNLGEPTGLYNQFPTLAGELAQNPPDINAVFNQFIDDSTITLRRHTFDLRMTEALPGKSPVFAPSVLVSQYTYGCCAPNQTDIEQLQFNVPNLPLFRSGTAPFMGDYVDLAPGPTILPPTSQAGQNAQGNDNNQGDEDGDGDDWHFNTSASTPTIYHAAWTDNRDVQAPPDGDWTHYTPPNSPSLGTTSIFQPGTTPPACQAGFTGSRNQNIYTAPISGGLIFGAPSNSKTLGTTVFNGQTVPFQRAFVVVAQNGTQVVKSFRLTIANQPTGGSASFLQFSLLTTLDLSIPPLSSASRPVFVVSTNPTASVTVNIAEITAPQGTLVPSGLTGSTTLNPDATNPGITNPTETNPGITNPGITNFEVTDPGITNPGITNPTLTNPGITNPGITNPGITNSTFQNETVVNPGITNPGITNPGITNPTIADPGITNPGITNTNPANVSISDTQWTVVNNGNTTGAYTLNLASSSTVPQGNVLQLIISKLYQTPAAPTGTSCNLAVQTHYGIVTNIVNPAVLSPTDPGITNPGITNPGITNATVSLAPGETANIDVRVINTDFHTFPTFNPAASIVPVAVSQSVDTQAALASGGTGTIPPPPISVPPLLITTTSLPDGVAGAVYTALIGTQGGNPTAHTFTVTAGTLPAGLTINATTGAITGIPTAVGASTFTVQVQDVGSTLFTQHTATQQLSIRISAPLTITTAPTLVAATQGGTYSQAVATTGGVGPFTFSVVAGALPAGVTMNSAGVIAGIPTGTGTSTFTVQATDSSNPPQVTTQTFAITVTNGQVPTVVTFVTQPENSVEGQPLANSPIQVRVTDATGAPIANVSVGMILNGPAPCATAQLGGTVPQTTDATGTASFADLRVNRGQAGFSLLATAGNAVGTSSLFNVEGYCDTGNTVVARHNQQVIALTNGKVLVVGGDANSNFTGAQASAELYDPVAHTFTAVGSMHAARVDFTTTLLQNGQVLVTGGFNDTTLNASAELFDPSTNTFTLLPNSMTIARSEHTATLLASGKVLITGGNNISGVAVATAEIFDPATNAFTATSQPMNAIRQVQHADLLPNGQVLISGGFDVNNVPLASAELYNPVTDTFTPTGGMTTARGNHGSALLFNGRVLVAGGLTPSGTTTALTATAELYNPATGTFTPTGSMSQPRATYSGIVLNDGRVFFSAGASLPGGANADIYDPVAGTFSASGPFTLVQGGVRDAILPDGTVLLATGVNVNVVPVTASEIFYPIAPPANIAITTTALPNAVEDQPYTQVLLEKGGTGNLLWTQGQSALPPGLTLSTSGIFMGTPTASGTFTFTVQVSDSATPQKTASATFTINVSGVPLQFTSNTVPTGGFGRFYSQPLPIIGGQQPYTVTQTGGTLPPGLSLGSNGTLAGTPSGPGSFTFTVRAVDSSTQQQIATQTFTMAIDTLFITTTVLPSGIVGVPYNGPITTTGGTLPLSFSLATTSFPPGLTIQQPGTGSNSGALAGTPTTAGEFTFSESVADSSNPRQTATQKYVVTIAPTGTAVPASLTFVTQPQNSVGGQPLNGGPIAVRVTDASNNPIPATTVVMTLTGVFGTPLPCATAILGGTLEGVTDATGQATFSNLSIDRGAFDYSLSASTGSISQLSGPFSVQGFCGSGNLSTEREFQTQYLVGTAQSTFKFPVDPKGAYIFTNTNPAAPGAPDIPDAPLIIPLASLGIKPGNVITGLPVGDTNACSPGSFCFGEFFQPSTCAVFSSSSTLLPSGGTINRIPGAIAPDFTTAFSCFTPPTAFGNLPTDIPQDFVLFGEPVTVPPGAAFLFVALADSFYTDNSDPNGDFGVEITVNSPSSVNGEVLIAGGEDNNGNALSTAELYHPALGFTSPTGSLSDPNGRALHATAMLPNGKILLAGGASNVATLASAELYDPATGTFTPTGSMTEPRFFAEAVLLADGRVLVTGGFNTNVALNTAEIYDPNTGLFTPTGSMNEGRGRHQMTLLPNGKVLVTGGRDAAVNFRGLSSAEIFDPAANQGAGAFTLIGNMNSIRFVHTATLLSNGTVLIAGGFNAGNESLSVTSAEIYDPSANTFTLTGSMNIARARFTATLLPDGTVLMAGGINSVQGVAAPAPSEIYSPATGTFTLTGAMITGRELTRATQLVNGNVLVAGGDDGVNILSSTEVYYNTVPQAPIVITTTSLPNGFISQPYVRLLLSQNRSGPITWSVVSGTLPPGLSLFGALPPGISAGAGASGVLSGTPTATGSFTFTLQATDGISTATSTFTINVSLATLAFTSSAMPAGGVGRVYSQPLPVTGGTLPYTATVTGGSLPPGLALSGTGVLSGTPSVVGSFTFTVNVTDASTPTQSAAQTLTIAIDNLFIITTALPDGIAGVPYNATISTVGGTLPLTFSAAAFPPGLTIQQPGAASQSGALSGIPTLVGHYTFTETVTDSSNPAQTAAQYYTMDVLPAGSTATPATLTFLSPPQNSVGGQILSGSPIRVHAVDANNAPVVGASVVLSFNGAPPCASVALTGTVTAITNGGGNAVFPDLSIDRGQLGYALLASAGSASAISQPFTVNGFCETNGPMSRPRELHSAVALRNGIVLVAGGADTSGVPTSSAELLSTSTGIFSSAGAMTRPRWGQTATVLRDGRVLITGGANSPSATAASVTNTAEVYDPSTQTFTATSGAMSSARYGHSATLLADGRVLIMGGGTALSQAGCLCYPAASALTNRAEVFDPATGLFTPTTAPMATARFEFTATLLPSGQVLIAGGVDANLLTLSSAELFDPVSSAFAATGSMSAPRHFHAASLLSNGKVLVAGGTNSTQTSRVQSAEIYDPRAGTFASAGNLVSPRAFLSAGFLPDGNVILPGGSDSLTDITNSAEIYNSGTGTFLGTGSLTSATALYGLTSLPDGTALVTGGQNSSGTLADAQIYYSTAPLAPLRVTTPTAAPPGTTVFRDPTSFGAATSGPAATNFNGIVPASSTFLGFNPLVLNGITFSTPLSSSGVLVNVTKSTFYTPSVYPGDFITDSVIPATGQQSANNTLVITLPASTTAFAMDFGGLGFRGASSGSITLSNGFSLPLSSLPTVGQTEFRGFVSTVPFNTMTFSAVNDDFVVLDVLLAGSDTILPGGAIGQPYTQMLLEQGGIGALTWTLASGSLPPGVTLRNDGVLVGTPTSGGTFTFAVHVVDSNTPQKSVVSGNFILNIASPLTFPAQTFNTGVVGTPYGGAITASGGTAPYSFAITSGATPAGVTLLSNGQFTGTPTLAGSSTFTVQVTDSSPSPQTASQTFSIQVVDPLAISTAALPGGTVGVPYSATVSSTGGVAPVTFVVGAGTFPPGLSLASNGAISGTPTSAGPFTFIVSATDSSTPIQTALQSYTVTITPAAIGPAATINFATQPATTTAGQPISPAVQLKVTDGNGNGVPGVTVTLGMSSGANRPILSGTLSAVTDATGTATFLNVVLDRAGTGYTLVASVAVASSSGAVQQITAPGSVLQGALESDTQIQFFAEQHGVTLFGPTLVDFSAPGTYSTAASLTNGSIPAGTVVDSYYFHSDPVGISRIVAQLQAGGVTFPTNVLGVILTDPTLAASDVPVRVPGAQYPPAGRGLALGSPTDTVILSADARTLTLHLSGMNATKDVRVITVANPAPNPVQTVSAAFNTLAAPGAITTVAGSTWVFPGAGPATAAPLGLGADFIGATTGLVTDSSGSVYIADQNNQMVFKVSGGALSIVAGTGVEGYFGDGGPALNARLDFPEDLAFSPAGELYIADGNNVIRKIDATGTISTVVGNGIVGYSGDNGPAANASLSFPTGIAFDGGGNLFIADNNNGVIRRVDTFGIITTVAPSSPPAGFTGFCAPQAIRAGPGNAIFIADSCLNQVLRLDSAENLTIVAGNGKTGYTGDGGPATNASLSGPSALAFDAAGHLFIADEFNNVIRRVDTAGIITTAIGQGGLGFTGDGGPGALALFAQPGGLTFDSTGNLYIADTENERVRKVDTTGTISTVAGNGRFKYAGDGGLATTASLDSPIGVTVDPNGNIFTADVANFAVRKINPQGVISTYAGTGVVGSYTGDGGPATSAIINFPIDVQADNASDILFSEGNRIHKIGPSGIISSLLSGVSNTNPNGGGLHFAADRAGNIYFDSSSDQVSKLDTTGTVSLVAGTGLHGFSGDGGPATSAALRLVRDLAVDSAGNLYIADQANHRVRRVDTNGTITTVAGNGSTTISGDGGLATSAGVPSPFALSVDGAGNLFIGSAGRVRKVDGSGTITTIAGGGFIGAAVDGIPATSTAFSAIQGLAFDGAGNLYVSDRLNDRIRKITGVTTTPPFIFNPPSGLTIVTNGLPHGNVGASYFQTLSAVGGTSPYTWTALSGSLPAGLTLSSAGQISGTPTATGAFTFVVQVTDSAGATAAQSLTITINTPLALAPQTLPGGVVGTAYAASLAASGGTPPYAFSVRSGILPAGITASPSGLPAAILRLHRFQLT